MAVFRLCIQIMEDKDPEKFQGISHKNTNVFEKRTIKDWTKSCLCIIIVLVNKKRGRFREKNPVKETFL